MAAFQREHAYVAQAFDPSHIPDHKLAENQRPTKENRDVYLAATAGNLGALKTALAAGGNPNWYNKSDDGATALHAAASGGHAACIEVILQNGAVIEERLLTNNNSALHSAAGGGSSAHLEAAKVLVRASASVNIGNSYGNAPINAALIAGNREAVELLLESGADVHWTNNKGSSLLHFVGYSTAMSSAEKKALALKLVEAGVNIDAKDEDGMTPLHVVSQSGDKELATFLYENGADITLRDSKGNTPLQWAQINSHTAVSSLLSSGDKATGTKTTGNELLASNTAGMKARATAASGGSSGSRTPNKNIASAGTRGS